MSRSTGAKAAPSIWTTLSGLLPSLSWCSAPAMPEEEFIVPENVVPRSNDNDANEVTPPALLDELFKAIRNERLRRVHALLNERTVNFLHPTRQLYPIHASILSGWLAMAEMVIKAGADLNKKDGFGRTPLMLAAEQNDRSMVQLLLTHGADPASLAEFLERKKERHEPEVWTRVWLFKVNNFGLFWHYAICFDDVVIDFGDCARGGTAIPNSGLEIFCKEETQDPDTHELLGRVPCSPGELLAMAILMGPNGWARRDYAFSHHNCQDWCESFAGRLGLKLRGDAYLQTKWAAQAWVKQLTKA